jgi:hypothetical protein
VVDDVELDNVGRFTYMGSNITLDLDCKKEIWVRIVKATAVLKAKDTVWKSKEIGISTKMNVLRTCVISTMSYGREAWIMIKDAKCRLLSFDRKCYTKILNIRWIQKATNDEVCERVQRKETTPQKISQRKLRLFGHICQLKNERKVKTLVFGMTKG